MRKIFTLITALTLALAAQAQQLPNNGFEEEWGDCTPWTPSGNKTKTGTEPASWHIAQVVGMGGLGATIVGEQVEGYNDGKAVHLINTANIIMATQIVPGYLTLGTPWNTSVMGNKNDGGTFGGISFDKRPDALSFMYKRSHGDDPATVVAYTWIGSTTQVNVPANIVAFGNPTKVTMKNRDRNILGIETIYGEEITKSADFQLVSSINTTIEGTAADWTSKVFEFKYEGKQLYPENLNVVFASGKYFENDNKAGDDLTVDDVKLVYYSRLSDLTVGGKTIEGFSPDKYEYTITTDGDPDDLLFDIEKTVKGYAAKATESGTADNYTIKVTNPDGEDIDGLSTHTYTIHVKKAAAEQRHEGKLNISMMGAELTTAQAGNIVITPTGENKIMFTLPNFSLTIGDTPMSLGDIVVPNVDTYYDAANARTYYKGEVKGMVLTPQIAATKAVTRADDDQLVADVEVKGYITDAGATHLEIPVTWNGIPIAVQFYSEGVDLNETITLPETLGITTLPVAPRSAAATYNVAGQRVAAASRGLRIVRSADGRVVKVVK